MSIIKTADRGLGRNHSTMQVAKLGQGAIFATTMFLATTRQYELILALLNCANRNTADLPRPTLIADQLQKHWRAGLALAAGAVAGIVSGLITPLVNSAAEVVHPGFHVLDQETVKSMIKIAFVPFGMLVFFGLKSLLSATAKWTKAFIGS